MLQDLREGVRLDLQSLTGRLSDGSLTGMADSGWFPLGVFNLKRLIEIDMHRFAHLTHALNDLFPVRFNSSITEAL